jgi:hypothetical protein
MSMKSRAAAIVLGLISVAAAAAAIDKSLN